MFSGIISHCCTIPIVNYFSKYLSFATDRTEKIKPWVESNPASDNRYNHQDIKDCITLHRTLKVDSSIDLNTKRNWIFALYIPNSETNLNLTTWNFLNV